MSKRFFTILLLLFVQYYSFAQNGSGCIALGQLPETALPICGSIGLNQTSVPIFSSNSLVVPGCSSSAANDYSDKNPFWYKFTCYASGPLSFTISPNNLGDDYDWQLYDVTGRNVRDVFTDPSLVVTGNWSGSSGPTGASASGVNYIQCASIPSDNAPTFAQMPQLIQGHHYLLLISHYSNSQSGYSITFGTGKENITDNSVPAVIAVKANDCNGKIIGVKLNKKIMCKSITRTGTIEFELTTLAGTSINNPVIIESFGNACVSGNCNSGFDTDSITLITDNNIPPGNYRLKIINGTDGNTITDNCENAIPLGTLTIPFTVVPKMNPSITHDIKYGCNYDTVYYLITDTTAIRNYYWTFEDGLSFHSTLPNPVVYYTIFGNKIATLEVSNAYNCKVIIKDTIYLYNTLKAAFEGTMFVCPDDSAVFKDISMGDSIVLWNWNFGNGMIISENSSQSHTQYFEYNPNNDYQVPVSLSITNNLGCTDYTSKKITIVKNCFIAVPSAFTPNNDGLNDYLFPINAYNTKNLKFSIFTRYGNRIFHSEDWKKKWDGKINGQEADAGTYVWFLSYFDMIKNRQVETKGTSILIR